MDEEGTLVRIDRVGLFTRSGLEGKLPLIFAEYGDLWLKNDGKIGYFKTAWYGKNWQSTLSDVRDVREVNRLTALRCDLDVFPDLASMMDITVDEKRFILLFTGIVEFKTTVENLISHIPGVHHLGAALVDMKVGWQNRGNVQRAHDAREFWWDLLTNEYLAGLDRPNHDVHR